MRFRSIELVGWRQFERVRIDFDDRLTILTGANGSGKTTILNILGRHYNWNVNFVSTPLRDSQSGAIRYLLDVFRRGLRQDGAINQDAVVNIGNIAYSNGVTSLIQIPVQVSQQYGVHIPDQQKIPGLYIPSHRPIYSYQRVEHIPTQAFKREDVYNEYFMSSFQRFMGQHYQKSPSQVMKQALISLALFGKGNEYVTPDNAAAALFEGFQTVLSAVLPKGLGFLRLQIELPEVVLDTSSGRFSLDAISGGVASIIDMAWRIFMHSPQGNEFVCTIDEPENHLHPELQQSLLPNLVDAFPNVQFVIATHSPFMISAVYDSAVYVLDYNSQRKIESQRLEAVNKAGTANEILRDVLGLPFTMPLWAGEKLKSIVSRYAERDVTDEVLVELEEELASAGLQDFVPETPKMPSLEEDL